MIVEWHVEEMSYTAVSWTLACCSPPRLYSPSRYLAKAVTAAWKWPLSPHLDPKGAELRSWHADSPTTPALSNSLLPRCGCLSLGYCPGLPTAHIQSHVKPSKWTVLSNGQFIPHLQINHVKSSKSASQPTLVPQHLGSWFQMCETEQCQ